MTNTSLSRTLAETANLISNSTSQEKIAEFIISDKKRFYVKVTKHPTNKNALLVTSSIDSPSSGGSPRQISKSDFMSFIKSYDKDNVGPKGKEHYYVDYDDGTYQFKIGETWQKLFLGNSMSQLSPTARIAHIGHTYPKINSYHDWLQAISKSAMNEAANLISNEDYQTRERDRQMANTGKLGSSLDSKEKASKKVYGKDGKVVAKNLTAFVKKANSPKNEDIEEAAKASPLEDEFLTDLTNAQIAAIKPLMKSKNWNKLKAYLMSQKIVDKDFNNITKYKMDRDILSVLQRSFMDYHEQVEDIEEGASGKWARTTPLDSRAWGLNQLPAGVDLQKILKLISDHPSRDVNAKTDIKKAAAALAVDIKKIAGEVGNPDAKTIDAIALAIIRHDMVYAFPGGSIAVSAAANARGIYSPLPPIKKSPGKYAFHSWIGMEGTKASLQEDEFITESIIEFMLDKKVVLRKRIKDAEVRGARDEWIKFGVLPYESNKEASEKYRKPWKVSTKFVPSGINQGPGYKAGQQRDAVIKESVEHVEEGALNDLKVPAGVNLGKII